MNPIFHRILMTGALVSLAVSWPAAAQPQAELRSGITPLPKETGYLCPNNGYLSGLSVKLTDRVVALFAKCQTATWNGLWSTDAATSERVAGDPKPYDVLLDCPPNYFLTGIGYTTGDYVAEGHGAAQASDRMIADLRPVCRLQLGQPYMLNRNFLVGADDNDLSEVFWQDGNPRDCASGSAAVGVAINYYGKRDADPNNRFYDVALYCRKLTIGVNPAAMHVPHH